jgi:hypothetical protein
MCVAHPIFFGFFVSAISLFRAEALSTLIFKWLVSSFLARLRVARLSAPRGLPEGTKKLSLPATMPPHARVT